MTRFGRALFTLACGLALAAAVHIVAVLVAPSFADEGPLARRMAGAPPHRTSLWPAPTPADPGLPFTDPATAIAVCPYDLTGDPVRVRIATGDELMTLSFHATDGRVFHALSDRAAQRGVVEIVLMTRAQLDEALGLEEEDDAPRDVRVVAPATRGYAVARALAPQPGEAPNARLIAGGLSCAPDAAALGR